MRVLCWLIGHRRNERGHPIQALPGMVPALNIPIVSLFLVRSLPPKFRLRLARHLFSSWYGDFPRNVSRASRGTFSLLGTELFRFPARGDGLSRWHHCCFFLLLRYCSSKDHRIIGSYAAEGGGQRIKGSTAATKTFLKISKTQIFHLLWNVQKWGFWENFFFKGSPCNSSFEILLEKKQQCPIGLVSLESKNQ